MRDALTTQHKDVRQTCSMEYRQIHKIKSNSVSCKEQRNGPRKGSMEVKRGSNHVERQSVLEARVCLQLVVSGPW